MKHLLISRELPPAPYTPGGIGTYVNNIARLMAEHGETVHVIGQRWAGAPIKREILCGGRLIIHRIAPEDGSTRPSGESREECWREELRSFRNSPFPNQWFSFVAAPLAEQLIEEEGIDLIEGQEWEAPLYYFLLRRELGLGPDRQPPSFVHLHSPTEFIGRFNSQDAARPDLLAMKRMEDYCIKRADARLCPSQYLARQCESHYALADGSVSVIRLPIGTTRYIPREAKVWESGSICYVGRLEPRKGVIEWVDAAVQVAAEHPRISFDFVGADMPAGNTSVSMRQFLADRIPANLRDRFSFHDAQPRERLALFLSRATAAVVPSRWENFPNTCIEAMCSGLPVIATRFGGMAEMIEDGETGWLAKSDGLSSMVTGLQDALRRCIAAGPDRRRAMGEAATASIRRLCDNRRAIREHLAFRARIATRCHSTSRSAAIITSTPPVPAQADGKGIGVVLWVQRLGGRRAVLDSLRCQTRAPSVLVLVGPAGSELEKTAADLNATYVECDTDTAGQAWLRGFEVASRKSSPLGWMFLDTHDELTPDALARLAHAMASAPSVGVLSCWTAVAGEPRHLHLPLNPELPHLWMSDEVGRATVFRGDVVTDAAAHCNKLPLPGFDAWSLTVCALVGGWRALTYPAALVKRNCDDLSLSWAAVPEFRERRANLMQLHAGAVAQDLIALIDTYAPTAAVPPVSADSRKLGKRPAPASTAQRLKQLLRRHLPPDSFTRRMIRGLRDPRTIYRSMARGCMRTSGARTPLARPRGDR